MQFSHYKEEHNIIERIDSLSRRENLPFIYKRLVLIRISI